MTSERLFNSFIPQKNFYRGLPPKQISGYAPDGAIIANIVTNRYAKLHDDRLRNGKAIVLLITTTTTTTTFVALGDPFSGLKRKGRT